MAKQTSSSQDFTMSTTAVWQALWGGVFDAFITANGWTYVAQTGDGNPNSATPGAAGTYACFRCYSTTVGAETWYVRVDYGYTANGPSLKINAGSGVNGSGTLTGQVGTQKTFTFAANHAGAGQTYYISSATGRLFFYVGPASAGGNDEWWFLLHGGVDGSGSLSSGMEFWCYPSGGQLIPVSGTVPAALSIIPCNQSTSSANVIGAHTMTFHPFLWDETGGKNPTLALFVGGITDYPSTGVIATITLYGSSHDYLTTAIGSSFSGNLRLCFRYE